MKVLELNHVAIHVADVERSAAFYREVLRLEPLPRPAFDYPGAWFRLGARQELHLLGRPIAVTRKVWHPTDGERPVCLARRLIIARTARR